MTMLPSFFEDFLLPAKDLNGILVWASDLSLVSVSGAIWLRSFRSDSPNLDMGLLCLFGFNKSALGSVFSLKKTLLLNDLLLLSGLGLPPDVVNREVVAYA